RIGGWIELPAFIRGSRPRSRVIGDGDGAARIDRRIRLEIAAPGFEAHHTIGDSACGLPLAEAGQHDVGFAPILLRDLREDERCDAVRIVDARPLPDLYRVKNAQVRSHFEV